MEWDGMEWVIMGWLVMIMVAAVVEVCGYKLICKAGEKREREKEEKRRRGGQEERRTGRRRGDRIKVPGQVPSTSLFL